jgi:tetratricopeptide (TPR) repeat protein
MEAVACVEAVERDRLLESLAQLVDKSLVVADIAADRPSRYRLLEPLRQFGRRRLGERGELQTTQQRHAAFFLSLSEGAMRELAWWTHTDRLILELDNLRAALRWLIDVGDVDGAQRLAGASGVMWSFGFSAEGRGWLEETLALDDAGQHCAVLVDSASGASEQAQGTQDPDSEVRGVSARARVLWVLGMLTVHQGDIQVAEESLSCSLGLYRRLGDGGAAAWPLKYLGRVAQLRGEFARARQFLEEALVASEALMADLPFDVFGSPVHSCLAQVAQEEGNLIEAQQHAEEALELADAIGFQSFVCQASIILGEVHHKQHRMEAARSVWEASLGRVRETRQRFDHMVQLLIDLGRLARERGDLTSTRSLLTEALLCAEDLSRWQLAHALEAVAEVADGDDRASSILQVAATAAVLRDALGTPLWPTEQARLDTALARTRESLSSDKADLAWRRGWSAPVHQSVAMAVQLLKEI